MKNLILIALALVTLQASAQDKKESHRKERSERMSEFTPQEMAELQTKKMTLHLDLTEAQQQKIMALNLENAKDRKSMMENRKKLMEDKESKEVSKEDKLKMRNTMLDKQIATKKKMKAILDDKQFAKWEEMASKRGGKARGQKKAMMYKKKE